MEKIKVSKKTAKAIDYLFCTIYLVLAFWADWRIGLAFIAFDVMRTFEDLQHGR